MFDRIFSKFWLVFEKFDDDFMPTGAISNKKLFGQGKDKLVVLFPPMGNAAIVLNILIKRLVKQNYTVLAYHFDTNVLHPDATKTLESFKYIQKAISDDLNKKTDRLHFQRVSLIGMSLGSVHMSMVAKQFGRFDNAVIVCGGSSPPDNVHNGVRTTALSKCLNGTGYTKEKLNTYWNELDPINYTKYFSGKEVEFIMSPKDQIVFTRNQVKLYNQLNRDGASTRKKISNFGHYFTVINYCLFGKLDNL